MKILLLLALLCLALGEASKCLHKVDCGYSGISQAECESNGCCWDPSQPNLWCSAPACSDAKSCSNHGTCVDGACQCESGWEGYNCADTEITTVHVIQSCHLDVGFADSAIGIINRYFDHHFPMCIEVGRELRSTSEYRLRFMTQSYLVSLYLDCPPNMGIHCPNDTMRQAFIEAMKIGDVTYHAFPFNAEPELYTPSLVAAGVEITHMLDRQLGLAEKRTLSQRDVPGMTRGMLKVLRDAGVNAISVGVNGASTPPQVPKIFVWRDEKQDAEVYGMWHPYGYGGYSRAEAVIVPGLSHAMVFDWNGDNAGPYTTAQYIEHFQAIQKEFPKAQIIASTFDNFTQHLDAYKHNLPVITSEIGDTWLYGCPSDARKLAVMRAFNRVWDRYVGADPAIMRKALNIDAVFANTTRLMLKLGEHTWGKDVKSNLYDNAHWSNVDFEWARTSGPNRTQYNILEESWWEQRTIGIDIPLQTLRASEHPLYVPMRWELEALNPSPPNPEEYGFYHADKVAGETFLCGTVTVTFDEATGAMNGLQTPDGQWLNKSHMLGLLDYRTYSQDDINHFLAEYLTSQPPPDWAFRDFGKPNCTVSDRLRFTGELKSFWYLHDQPGCRFLVEQVFDSKAVTQYGAPETAWTYWEVFDDEHEGVRLRMDVSMFNKTSTRLPEAMFITFNPVSPHKTPAWTMSKLDDVISVTDIVTGGSKHQHNADSVRFADTLQIDLIDSSVICVGEPNGYPTPTNVTADWSSWGVSSMVFNNLWGTNYVMWQPFNRNYTRVAGEENYLFRFNMKM